MAGCGGVTVGTARRGDRFTGVVGRAVCTATVGAARTGPTDRADKTCGADPLGYEFIGARADETTSVTVNAGTVGVVTVGTDCSMDRVDDVESTGVLLTLT